MMMARFICLLFLISTSIWAQVSKMTLYVEDLNGKSISGVSIIPKPGSSDAATDDGGRTTLHIAREVRPGEEIEIQMVGNSEWVFLSPRQTIQYPDVPGKPVTVIVVRKGDREILASSSAKMAIVQSLLTLIDTRFDVSSRSADEERQKLALKAVAENLGIESQVIDEAIRAWKDQTEDPFALGLAALYEKKFSEAVSQLEKSYEKAKLEKEETDKVLAERAFYLGQALYEDGKILDSLRKFREAVNLEPHHQEYASGLSIVLLRMEFHKEAEPLIKRALAIDEASFGPDHPNVAVRLSNLAQLLQATHRLQEAEPLMTRALAIDEATYGVDHPEVAISLNNLAQLLQDTNRLQEAESLMSRALSIDKEYYGANHPNVVIRINNLAQLLQATNRLQEAESLVKRALSIGETYLGSDHPDVAISLSIHAILLKATNRLQEAEPLMTRALAINEATYGADHPEVAVSLNNLAQLLQATNRVEEAEPLMRRALAIFETAYGPQHPKVATGLNNLAGLFQFTNRLGEAEPLMRRALSIDEASLGPKHPKTVVRIWNLLNIYARLNQVKALEKTLQKLVWLTETKESELHSGTLQTIRIYLIQFLQTRQKKEERGPENIFIVEARAYASQNDWISATWHYQQALLDYTGQNPSAAQALNQNMVAIGFIKQGFGEEAIPYLEFALAFFKKEDPQSDMIGTIYNNLGSAYKTMGQWSQSWDWLCQSVDWALEPGHDESVLVFTHGHLAEVHCMLRELDQAIYHGEQSLSLCLHQSNYARARETFNILVTIYRELGNSSRVKELQAMEKQWPQP